MRKKLLIVGATGALTLAGLGVALPAVADDDEPAAASGAEERIRDALAGLVEDGSITPEQADEVAATLSDTGLPGLGGPGWHGPGRLAFSTAAETLGLTEEELRTALEAGDASLATVAEAQSVAVEDLIAALVQAQTDRIEQAVEDGRLTRDEAEDLLADLEERVTERVNSTDLGGFGAGQGPGGHGGHGPGAGQVPGHGPGADHGPWGDPDD